MRMAFFGSSLLSSYWNGAATYYRGLIAALDGLGWRTTFYEPDAFERQQHRDIDPPAWARSVVYKPDAESAQAAVREAQSADVIVKASGIGVLDDEILSLILALDAPHAVRVFWDVDAPATLASLAADRDNALRDAIPRLDAVLTYGGGKPVVDAYRALGAEHCEPIYNAVDPATHFPVSREPRFGASVAFLGNRLPDREARVDEFFFKPARALPGELFLLGGSGWDQTTLPSNVRLLGHVPTADHNAFNVTPRAVLNISRESMAGTGFSPATRVFEAAGAGACLITDAWEGIDTFLEPGREVLVAACGDDVVDHLRTLSSERAQEIGSRARARILRDHTYEKRAAQVAAVLGDIVRHKRRQCVA